MVARSTDKPAKPASIADLAKIIPNITAKQPSNVARIIPPSGTPYPDKAIMQIYNPAQRNIKVKSLRTTATNDLKVRTNGPDDIKQLSMSKTLIRNGYKVVPITAKNPKIIIFGITIPNKEMLIEAILEQNADIVGDDPDEFKSKFKPVHSWSRNKKSFNWVVEVDPEIRKAIMVNARLYNCWQSHRVADYIDATRCYRCHRYGHVSKHCNQAKETCGHCAQSDHSFKNCPNLGGPPQCPACKMNKLPAAHRVVDRSCPTFLRAAKTQLIRTNYNN